MNKKIAILISVLCASFSLTQAQTAMGKWRAHFSYNSVSQVTQSDNKVFAVSDGALFSIDKKDESIGTFSKVNGLNGANIVNLKYDEVSKKLLIIYSNGNIDFLSEDGISNLPDFYNKQMSVDKTVNHILFDNGKAYLSCNFGIITVNMTKQEIQDTYYIGTNASEVKVLNTATLNNQIYAASATDVYVASLSDPYLVSYEHWSKLSGLPGSGDIQNLTVFADQLILQRNGTLYKKGIDNVWTGLDNATQYSKITVSGGYLLAMTGTAAVLFNKQLQKTSLPNLPSAVYGGIYESSANQFWFAAGNNGVVKYNLANNSVAAFMKPIGPATNKADKLVFAGKRLFVLPGRKWVGPVGNPGYVMIYENNEWKNILNNEIAAQLNIRVEDFSSIAVDPDDNTHFYVTSGNTGLYEFKNDKFYKHYDRNNSLIENISFIPDDYYYQWIDNAVMDKDKNVWITNDWTTNAIKILKPNGDWTKLSYAGLIGKQSLGQILISNLNKNQKWVLSRRHMPGLCIFDDNGTIDDQKDDKTLFFPSFMDPDKTGSYISPAFYFCMVQDKNGVIWLGTDKGPLIFSNPNKAFETGFTCSRVKIPRNDGTNLADYLLENERIWAMAIDGANRRWVGTESSGLYLLSENGQQTIRHFTEENSPLLSNYIFSVNIHPVTGEVFIGTANGLISYQSDAATSSDVFSDVHVYPNPVRENFTGLITITGLVDKTSVKITDVAGNLVCQTISNGSIATWDGKNGYGRKVSTGVYLALCVSPDGEQSITTKILVIN